MANLKAILLRNNTPEALFYLACWVFVLLVPIFLEAYDSATDSNISFQWSEIAFAYIGYIPFFVCFLLGKLVLEPRYYFAGHYKRFFAYSVLAAFIVTFAFSYVAPQRRRFQRHEGQRFERQVQQSEALRDSILKATMPPPPEIDAERGHRHHRPERGPEHIGRDGRPHPDKPLMRGPFLPMFMMTLLMMGASLGVAIAFRYRRDQLASKEKQAARLQSELDYLKYQINPHFFMNTLNNIHALVDIDGELAKEAIIELSRLMRYLLYESNQPTVPISKELSFVQQYLELMRLRCDDTVTISYERPSDSNLALQTCIPPMLLISFIENAFKHGISHKEHSFIQVSISCEDERFHFHCHNSNFSNESTLQQQGGVGLDNVRKRLELIYPGRYTLEIVPAETDFTVDLWLPLGCSETINK